MAYERNLVLVHTERLQARSDYETIAARLAERAPDIEVFIVNNRIPNSVTRRTAARRPALIFSPVPLQAFAPPRGRIYAGRNLPKWEEIRRLVAAGIPVPEAVRLLPDTRLDPATWGPFTVVKPSRGMQGKGVRLQRTRDVRWVDPKSLAPDDPRYGLELIAQRFIDTGPQSTHTRVMTVLGRVAYATTTRHIAPRTFGNDPDGEAPFDEPIAANQGERTVTLESRPEFLPFGERVAAALPEIPVLGIDVIKEAATGKLYALEVNAAGLTWHISSNYGLAMQRARGIDLAGQFGALDIIADALIDVTRRQAE